MKTISMVFAVLMIIAAASFVDASPAIQFAYPVANDQSVIPGYEDIVVRFNIPADGLNLSIIPDIPHVQYYENCNEFWYTHYSHVYGEQPCYRLRMELYDPLELNQTYTVYVDGMAPVMAYSFRTGSEMFRAGAGEMHFSYPAPRKPKVASCGQFYATLWNDPQTGINFQKWDLNDNPMGSIVNVDSNLYYSSFIRVSMDMNDRCDMVIGYMNDYPVQRNSVRYNFKIYTDWDPDFRKWQQIMTLSFVGILPQDVIDNPQDDEMLFDNGGTAVAINNNGAYLLVWQQPKCIWEGGNIRNPWFCDNYVKAWLYNPPYTYGTFLGEYPPQSDFWSHNFAGQIVNVPPDANNFPATASHWCGGKGNAYDCPYHVEADLTNELAIIKWTEWGGNVNGPDAANTDDPVMRVYNLSTGAMSREVSVAITPTDTRVAFDQWGGRCAGKDGSNLVVCVWMDRTYNYPNGYPYFSDVKARLFWVSGASVTPLTGEVIIPQFNQGDQINPNVSFLGGDRILFVWESNSLNSAGGYGVYARITDSSLNPVSGDIRINENNIIRSNWEISNGSDWDLCDLWSDHVGLSCNSEESCYFAWNHPDYSPNGLSHGEGYSVKSAAIHPLIDQCAVNNGGCGDPRYGLCTNTVDAWPTCSAVDVCSVNNGGCGDPAHNVCVNVIGGPPICNETECVSFATGFTSKWAGYGYEENKASALRNWRYNEIPYPGDDVLMGSAYPQDVDWDLDFDLSGFKVTSSFPAETKIYINQPLAVYGKMTLEGGTMILNADVAIMDCP